MRLLVRSGRLGSADSYLALTHPEVRRRTFVCQESDDGGTGDLASTHLRAKRVEESL
jgi:hypothetical protein